MVSLFLIFCHDAVTQCSCFKAEKIEINGLRNLSRSNLLAHAGLHDGVNIFSVSLSQVRENLLAHPWVADAAVKRDLPSSLTVRVKEHTPLAVIDAGRKFIINTQGDVFKEWDPSDPDDLPLVKGLGYGDLQIPGTPSTMAFNAVIKVLRLGRKPGCIIPNTLITKIEIDRDVGVTLHAVDRCRKIKLGYGQFSEKYERLKDILFYLEKSRNIITIDQIDLNDLNRVIVNPVRSESLIMDQKEA